VPINQYENGFAERLAEPGAHRDLIGGLWDEMGQRQLDYLVAQGLLPEHRILDVGCGSLRAGVRLLPYLAAGHYYGIDAVPELLELGYEREIRPLGLNARLDPTTNLAATSDFAIPFPGVTFDVALAQSLFSHLPINHLRLCLAKLRPRMRDGAVFHATFFLAPDDLPYDRTVRQPPAGEIETYGWQDPYHYWRRDIEFAAEGLRWRLLSLDDWNHPRGQRMARFAAI
jgi:SAM-dependent methyltransferase